MRVEQTKKRILITFIVLSYLPFLLFTRPSLESADAFIIYLASLTGYLAATMLLWQFILGVRAISGLFFADIIWVNSLHKKLGIYGIVLVLAHPLLIAYTYGTSILVPGGVPETAFDQGVAFGRIALVLFLIIWLSSAVLRSRIAFRPWRYLHYLTFLIFPFVLLHAPAVGSFYAGETALQFWWQAMGVIFLAIVLIRILHLGMLRQYRYGLVAKKAAANEAVVYTLKPRRKAIKPPQPGQFVYTRLGLVSEEHPFTVAGFDAKSGHIQLIVKKTGRYTKRLAQYQKGADIYLSGPFGVFTREIKIDSNRPATLIAGGIGITPFLRHVFDGQHPKLTLFNANRSAEQVIFGPLLRKQLGSRYVDVFSESAPKSAERGFVTADLLRTRLGKTFSNQDFYICGPPIMMQKVRSSLLEAGIPSQQIKSEQFGL